MAPLGAFIFGVITGDWGCEITHHWSRSLIQRLKSLLVIPAFFLLFQLASYNVAAAQSLQAGNRGQAVSDGALAADMSSAELLAGDPGEAPDAPALDSASNASLAGEPAAITDTKLSKQDTESPNRLRVLIRKMFGWTPPSARMSALPTSKAEPEEAH